MLVENKNSKNSAIMESAAEGIEVYKNRFGEYPDFVVDIGAHHGGCSLYALDNGTIKAIIIEANPTNLDILRSKIKKEHLEKCSIFLINRIFSNTSNKKKMLNHVVNSNSGQHSAAYDINNPRFRRFVLTSQEILTMNIDDLWNYVDNDEIIDYLKVDIEGEEFNAFPVDNNTLDFFRWVKFIDFEIHDPKNTDYFCLNNFLEEHKEFNKNYSITEQYVNFLISCGFQVNRPASFDAVLGMKLFAENINLRK